ncbi:hypothetical protein F0L68_35615 [Solihabitans fulvus]|uniref:TrbL/VirB6 plasmid conjugal transfer protein n=1 Tax=Solihabitans fulvus TaxID=1892852 RepID=A0A5B2WNL2_9PSEU|nr:hypothetical protein [Solihabitans fulvus]KAA2252380.1 hypothetical protein F0L68_35615 [Solihabitans fulvus]
MSPDGVLLLPGVSPLGPTPVWVVGEAIASAAGSAFEMAMRVVWDAALAVLRTAFELADKLTVFSVSTTWGPVGALWPVMLWISGTLAVGLFFFQLTATALRGGRGFARLLTGPVHYGLALTMTTVAVATFLAAADGLTTGLLQTGLQTSNFQEALSHTTLDNAVATGVKAVVLGLCAIFGVVPAAFGYVLEMLFRAAAVYVLVATVPLVAAGLLAEVTTRWFWKVVRWLLAAIAMKPVLALALVVGVAMVGGAQGAAGLLVGVGVLLVSLLCPFALFSLFAFVDPNTDAGAGLRSWWSAQGVDGYRDHVPGFAALGQHFSQGVGGGGEEDTNTSRFDEAQNDLDLGDDHSGSSSGDTDALPAEDTTGPETSGGQTRSGDTTSPTAPGSGERSRDSDATHGVGGDSTPSTATTTDHTTSAAPRRGGDDEPPAAEEDGGQPPAPDGGNPRGGPKNGPGPSGGASAAGAAEDAAVML